MRRTDFIQFIGTQRSGSNLLRLMLNEHPKISAPHPPHLLRTFMPIVPDYQRTKGDSYLPKLAENMCQWVQANPVPWGVDFNVEAIAGRSSDILDVFGEIYRTKMVLDQAEIACCKSMANLYYVSQVEARFSPFYIYIYRDGRDVAASFKRAIVGDKHVYPLGKKWHEQQQLSMEFLKGLSPERYEKVAYEELLHDPAAVLERICDKLAVQYHPGMLRYYESKESQLTASSGKMWGNVTKPVMKGNSGNFRERLSAEEIDIFEQVAEDSLKGLGYHTTLNGAPRVLLDVEEFARLNREAKAKARENAPLEDKEKRKPQEELWTELTRELGMRDSPV